MKKIFVTLFCLGLTAPLFADGTNQFANENARISYAFGMLTGEQWKQQEVGFDADAYSRGIKDGLAGTTLLTTDEAREAFNAFRKEYAAKQQQKHNELAAKNKAEGEAFFTTNKVNPGIKLLPIALPGGKSSELQYLVLTNGTGPLPTASDR